MQLSKPSAGLTDAQGHTQVRVVYPENDLSPQGSRVFGYLYVAFVLVFAALLGVRVWRRGRLARQEEANAEKAASLQEGETVVSGVVEHAAGETVAVRVDIEQRGSEAESSGSWSHSWDEVSRETTVRPFYLRTDRGERIRVEAPTNVDVADDLDGRVWVERTRRTRYAELSRGERIFALGTLRRGHDPEAEQSAEGYRSQQRLGWRLEGTRGKMLLSSHPLGSDMRKRAAFHGRWLLAPLLAAVAFAFAMHGFVERARGGRVMVGEVTRLDHRVTRSDDGDTHYYDCVARTGAGEYKDLLNKEDWASLNKGDRLKLLVTPGSWQFGDEPTFNGFFALVLLGLLGGTFALYEQRRRSSRPWYRRKVNDKGSGRLPEPTTPFI